MKGYKINVLPLRLKENNRKIYKITASHKDLGINETRIAKNDKELNLIKKQFKERFFK